MDQVKIGKFIADRRKAKDLTQMQLAETLNITDRAVSKWETGRAMPDSSIMLELCEILEISVNDLLSGEMTVVENYDKELEKKLIEAIKAKESADKRLLSLEVIVGIFSSVILFVPIILAAILTLEDWQRVVLLLSGVAPAFVGFFFALKIEQVAGYYECKKCGHQYVPTYKSVNMAPHMGRTRYMRCPECHEKSWQKKIISKK